MLVLIKTLLFLIFVILLIYGCFYLAKKRAASLPPSRIKIVEHKRLDQKFSISLICVDDTEMLIIAGPQTATIKKLPSKNHRPLSVVAKKNSPTHPFLSSSGQASNKVASPRSFVYEE